MASVELKRERIWYGWEWNENGIKRKERKRKEIKHYWTGGVMAVPSGDSQICIHPTITEEIKSTFQSIS